MKKIIALLLAMLMLALPVLGCAATTGEIMDAARAEGQALRTDVTFTPGDLTTLLGSEYQEIYADVMNALTLSLQRAETEGSLTVSLEGTPVLTAALGLDETGTTYLSSNYLGDEVLAVAEDEWEPLMDRLLDLLVATGSMQRSGADALKEVFTGAGQGAATLTAEDLKAIDWSPVTDKVDALLAGATVETVEEQPEGCDPAAVKLMIDLTAVEAADLIEQVCACLQSSESLMAYLNSLNTEEMTAEEMLSTLVAQLKAAAADETDTLPITVWQNAEGETVCVNISEQDSNTAISYARETSEQGVKYVGFFITTDETNVSALECNYLDAGDAGEISVTVVNWDQGLNLNVKFDDSHVDFTMTLEADGETYTVAGNGTKQENAFDLALTMDVESNGETQSMGLKISNEQVPGDTSASAKGSMELSMTASGVTISLCGDYTTEAAATDAGAQSVTDAAVRLEVMGVSLDVLSVHAVTQTCEAGDSVITAEALHPATMSDEELEAWGARVMQAAQVEAIALVQALPTSVLMLMLGE